MPINKLFPDNALAATDLSRAEVPGLKGAGPNGPIVSEANLKLISDNIFINLSDGLVTASHSRPSMFAHIFSFAENVKKALKTVSDAASMNGYADYSKLEDFVRQDFIEWQGMVAAVALSNVYSGNGLNLSVKTVALDSRNLVHRCILREMDKGGCYKAAIVRDNYDMPQSGMLFYICQNDVPFALFHPEIGLCAMKAYDASIFEGVLPWHKAGMADCHKAWNPIAQPNESNLNDFCLSRIAWWASNLSNAKLEHPNAAGQLSMTDLQNYAAFLRKRLSNPSHTLNEELKAVNSIPGANAIDSVPLWKGLGHVFGTAMMFCRDENGAVCRLPLLFLDSMLLTSLADEKSNMLVYNRMVENAYGIANTEVTPLRFEDKNGVLRGYAPVAPFRNELIQLLNNCGMEKLTFEVISVDSRLKGIKVTIGLRTGDGEAFSMEKTYHSEQLRRGKVPYMMIWPYLPMPKMPDGSLPWKSFYATWQDQTGGMVRLRDCNDRDINTAQELTFDLEEQAVSRQILRATADHNSAWTVCNGEKPFRYALLKGKQHPHAPQETMGIVFMPKLPEASGAPMQINNENPVYLSVDFGTTSTVCALRHLNITSNEIINLPFQDYSYTVTCYAEDAKRKLDQEHWLGNTTGGSTWKWDEKIFSVAQLFQRADANDTTAPSRRIVSDAAKQEYYVDGRLVLVSGGVLTNYANKIKNDDDPLRRQQIMNDMKFATQLDVLNYQAASVYLAGIYTYAVLHLLNQNVVPTTLRADKCIELRVSYPNEVTLQALKDSWNNAASIVKKVMHPAFVMPLFGEKRYFNEATATAAYAAHEKKITGTVVSVDIGGGTSDISISKRFDKELGVSKLSVRYAGREMMVSSLIQTFRRIREGVPYSAQDFAELWLTRDTTLTNQFEELCEYRQERPTADFLRSLIADSTVRMNVEMLLAEGMSMNGPGKQFSTRLLRQLIALKFFMLMRVVARKVRDTIDDGDSRYLWENELDGGVNVVQGKLDVNLYINGTSAQMLQYIFDCDMEGLAELRGTVFNSKKNACKDLINNLFAEEMKGADGVDTCNVRIFVNADASKKVEVSHGMLCEEIECLAETERSRSEAEATEYLKKIVQDKNPDIEMSSQKRAERENKTKQQIAYYDLEKLKEYLEGSADKQGLIKYITKYERIFYPSSFDNADYGLGQDVPNISKLLDISSVTEAFAQIREKVAQERAKYMVEDEQSDYKDLLICMYLLEEIIDWEMAERQCR